jgi:hypothetical protein
LAPFAPEPMRELALLGYRPAQEVLFDAQLRLGGFEAVSTLTQHLVDLRRTLDPCSNRSRMCRR